ncbi:MAG: DUF305 domain-containing protein [Hamadaea sp.]|uniref:DUF305 domain-containing protein n=1 Tax=Hamadaea sp. TaxID=2024425 RepID=UPI0017CD262D|nr:DUF305 domain-containing protein [Hamadaea sp.]NUT22471.1 DUF305 domain-containing protein [Hamadaea sp.]
MNARTFGRSLGMIAGAATALVLALAGCGGAPSAPANSPAFNDADVMFLQMMVAYHAPGEKITALAAQRATRTEVKQLAAAIEVTEADEQKKVLGWLQEWNQPTEPATDTVLHADHGGLPGDGKAEVATLTKTAPDKFDKAFLTMLIGQQHGLVEAARAETAGGVNPEVKALAQRVTDSRRAQVAYMLTLAQ